MKGLSTKTAARTLRNKNRRVTAVFSAFVLCLTILALVLPAIALSKKEVVMDCPLTVHEHLESCYQIDENGDKVLACGQADYVVHTHDEACYDSEGNLICTLPEIQEHIHDESCYEDQQILVCDLEENEDHTHTDECYRTEKKLICGKDELHTHNESCFDAEGNLICDKIVLQSHQHDEACMKTVKKSEEEQLQDDEQVQGQEPAAAAEDQEVEEDPKEEIVSEVGVADEEKSDEPMVWEESTDKVTVHVEADSDAFPEGTTMQVRDVEDEDTIRSVSDAIDGEAATIKAVDISFYDSEGNEIEPAKPIRVSMTTRQKDSEKEAALSIVHVDDQGQANEVEDVDVEKKKKGKEATATFTAGEFSVYAVVYSVDFHYEVNGEKFDYSMPGGGFTSLAKLVEILGIEKDDPETEEDEIRDFLAYVENVEFSNPDLVWTGKVDKDTTLGELKDQYGLESQYSSNMSEQEIEEFNAREVLSGDWALVSLKAFETEESLTVRMKGGDEFVIRVTDAQEIPDASPTTIKADKSYLICYQVGNTYYLLKNDGSVDSTHNPSNFEGLNSSYCWRFNFVFEEKDREGTLTYEYYLIRPIDNNSKTIALYDETSADNPLVQQGNNNTAVVPVSGGGFRMVGYNDYRLNFENGQFKAKQSTEQNPFDGITVHIYEMDNLPTYDYKVWSSDETRGLVSVAGGTQQTRQDGSHYYQASSASDKTNAGTITASPVIHRDTHGINKWEFDYWELNGKKLDSEDYPATIAINDLEIPYNESELIAHFRQNSSYNVPDSEKEGTKIENMEEWLKKLKKRNIPLNPDGCDKTAEVYDYENRIYRVDLTAQSSLTTFDGDIDLGFVLDVSGSMHFPSLLAPSNDVANHSAKQISAINSNNNAQNWGLKTNKTYYIITDPNNTATVCYLYYYGNQWWLCDASKNRFAGQGDSNNNGRFNPATGWSVYGGQNYGDSYYSTSDSYVIQEAGDRVTQADWQDTDTRALLTKLGLNVGDPKSRAFYLEKSLNGTLDELKDILQALSIAKNDNEDPDVKIAWNTFKNFLPSGEGRIQHDFVSAKEDINLDYDKDTYGGGTSTDVALLDAAGVDRNDVRDRNSDSDRKNWHTDNNVDHTYTLNTASGFQWASSATKYAVLITDGAPQRGGKTITRRYVTEAAQQLKNRQVNLISVGLGMDNVTSGKRLLYDISDSLNNEKMFYSAKSGDELEDVLLQIVRTIMKDATIQGDVTDVIDEAFYPVDKNGKPLGNGTMINLAGEVTTDTSKPYGTVTYGPVNVGTEANPVMKNCFSVKWTNQDFTWDGWQGTVFVKAKEDLLGGNALATNENDALIEAKKYKIDGKDAINLETTKRDATTDPSTGEIITGEYNPEERLETPRVNVNELSFLHEETEWTVYLGTSVNPKDQIRELFDNIMVEEVIKKGKGKDSDGDGLKDVVQYQQGETDNNWYPISANSITDDRESQAGTVSGREFFYMKDLLKTLAAGKNYPWWDYSKNEPDWDTFLTMAMEGITIPYHVYGINDNSSIDITLTKEIVAGEETDLINKSPHDTTVESETEESTGKYKPVEKYTFTVKYSPDYDVLPKGQGGSSTTDFHVGNYGTMYQGHAAGTETSRNIHIINVFSKDLSISKTDETFSELLTDARFTLYRTARDTDTGTRESIKDAGGQTVEVVEVENLDLSGKTTGVIESLPALKTGEKYYLVETKAPEGYTLLPDPIEVQIVLTDDKSKKVMEEDENDTQTDVEAVVDGIYNWAQNAKLILVGSGFKRTNEDGSQEITSANIPSDTISDTAYYQIANNPGVELPATGGPGTHLISLFGLLLTGLAGTGLLMKRHRKKTI